MRRILTLHRWYTQHIQPKILLWFGYLNSLPRIQSGYPTMDTILGGGLTLYRGYNQPIPHRTPLWCCGSLLSTEDTVSVSYTGHPDGRNINFPHGIQSAYSTQITPLVGVGGCLLSTVDTVSISYTRHPWGYVNFLHGIQLTYSTQDTSLVGADVFSLQRT